MILTRSAAWWYWLATAILLAGAAGGVLWALPAAIALCGVQVLHYRTTEGSFAAFPVQIRLAFLAMLLAGLWEPLRFLHWVQLAGTTTFVLSGYCLLARLLGLAPWNRTEPLSGALVRRALVGPPAPACGSRAGGCSLRHELVR
jgi:hypothetical protein